MISTRAPSVLDGLLGHGQAEQARAHDHQIGIFHRFSHKNNLPNLKTNTQYSCAIPHQACPSALLNAGCSWGSGILTFDFPVSLVVGLAASRIMAWSVWFVRGLRRRLRCGSCGLRRGSVRAWCTLVFASAWRYVTQLPQGRNAARVSGLFRVRGGFLYIFMPIRSPTVGPMPYSR